MAKTLRKMVDDIATAWAISPAGALRQLATERIVNKKEKEQVDLKDVTIQAKNKDKVKKK